MPTDLDSSGKLVGQYRALESHFATYGVKLDYRIQQVKEDALPLLEWALSNSEIDFVLHPETGATPPNSVSERFRSAGTIGRSAWFVYARKDVDITNLRDIKGKKIMVWSSPEGKAEVPFMKKNYVPSIYSDDWILYRIFKALNITQENSTIVNPWPMLVTMSMEWDVFISAGRTTIFKEISAKNIKLPNIRDISALDKLTPYETYLVPESSFSIESNVPASEMRVLTTYFSVAVKKDLDPSLVLILAEALQKNYSPKEIGREQNEFPNFASQHMFSAHPVAIQFYRVGKPFLTNYISPSFATLLMTLMLVLVPAITILWPIAHLLPKVYAFYVKHKIVNLYADLEIIDKSFGTVDAATRKIYAEMVDKIEERLRQMRLPLLHAHHLQELFTVRVHVNLMRNKLKEFEQRKT